MKTIEEARDILSKPIQPDEVEWRVQNFNEAKGILSIVPYITNRCVMDRFDEAFDYLWSNEFRETTTGYICRIQASVANDEVPFLIHEDGATKTKIEPDKGGMSDAMKRTAVHFGLGRCLYKYPRITIKTNSKYIPFEIYPRLNKMVEAINKGEFKKDFVTL